MKTKDTDRERLHGEPLQGQTPAGQPHAQPMQGQRPQGERLTTADVARAANAPAAAQNREQVAALERGANPGAESAAPLLAPDVTQDFKSRWLEVQTGFVDTPREAVERADELVADAIKRLAESFAQERSKLESQWARDGDVSTEDLRVALQRYRSFFERLLHV
jgi:hypothetical protein